MTRKTAGRRRRQTAVVALGSVSALLLAGCSQSTVDDWKRFAQRHGNETIFKYSVTLLDNIEFIVARSDNERREIIQSFTRRGIKKLPDGRKVEDIVHTPQSWSKRKQ